MPMKNTISYNQGYITLMSAIIISALLLAITVSLGFNGLFGRLNIVDSESKERSSALAKACVDQEILNLAKEVPYTNPVQVGSDQCTIVSVAADVPNVGQTTIKTQAVINKSYTDLQVIIDSSNFSIISWQECATFDSCV